MAPTENGVDSGGRDELDALLDNDAAVQDFLQDLPFDNENGRTTAVPTSRETRDEDQEVQVKKKRAPIPKLDETRLLSSNGIPKLRKITKTRLKIRGKGHEFSDMSCLLNTYQLWLDDLFPRAKFRDALLMVEKVGHSKRMQVTRKAWLDETKPFRKEPSLDRLADERGMHEPRGEVHDEDLFADMVQEQEAENNASLRREDGAPPADELDELLVDDGGRAAMESATHASRTRRGPFDEQSPQDQPDEDDLDALLAEADARAERAHITAPQPRDRAKHSTEHMGSSNVSQENDFSAEEEALAEMGFDW